jgi:hypothetical protein
MAKPMDQAKRKACFAVAWQPKDRGWVPAGPLWAAGGQLDLVAPFRGGSEKFRRPFPKKSEVAE